MLFFNEETEALEMHTAWGQGSLKGEKKKTQHKTLLKISNIF